MAVWLDGIVDEKTWREQEQRLLIVCPEPNEKWMQVHGDNRRDMRELLRHPEGIRKRFYVQLRQAVRAFYCLPSRSEPGEEQEHSSLMSRIAFIDLKNTGGVESSNPREIEEATRKRQRELIEQIIDIDPTHVGVAGKAWAAFDACIRPHIPSNVKIAAIWHPSYRFTNAKIYYQTVKAQFCR